MKISKENAAKSWWANTCIVIGIITCFSNLPTGFFLIVVGIAIKAWAISSEYNRQGQPRYFNGINENDLMVTVDGIWLLKGNSQAVSMMAALTDKNVSEIMNLMDQCQKNKTAASFYDLPYPTNILILQGLFLENGLSSSIRHKPNAYGVEGIGPSATATLRAKTSVIDSKICPNCSEANHPFFSNCRKCNSFLDEQEQPMFYQEGVRTKLCPSCREANNPSFSNCWKCSAPFPMNNLEIKEPDQSHLTEEEYNQKTRIIMFWVVGGFLVCLFFLVFATAFRGQKSQSRDGAYSQTSAPDQTLYTNGKSEPYTQVLKPVDPPAPRLTDQLTPEELRRQNYLNSLSRNTGTELK